MTRKAEAARGLSEELMEKLWALDGPDELLALLDRYPDLEHGRAAEQLRQMAEMPGFGAGFTPFVELIAVVRTRPEDAWVEFERRRDEAKRAGESLERTLAAIEAASAAQDYDTVVALAGPAAEAAEAVGLGLVAGRLHSQHGLALLRRTSADRAQDLEQAIKTLVQRADIAMYLAKGRGGGQALYDPASDLYDAERLLLIGDLRRAIADDELVVHYQPKFGTGDLGLAGVEALVRWQHPIRGLVAPGDFIPLAERTGAIRPLTLVVLRKAARQWRAWHEQGLDITIAVNLSVANLLDGELTDDIARILSEARVPANGLELEITETTVMTDPLRATAMLEQLAAMGIRLSIDDYGTGHSSLAYLRRLPVHELKIERTFIEHLAVDADDLQVARGTIELAHHLGLRVVAEGVEDARSLALLNELGCDLAQGFYLGRPVPADELFDQLRDRGVTLPV